MKWGNDDEKCGKICGVTAKGKVKKYTLPNTALNYTGVQEQKDLSDYYIYLCSFEFDELRRVEVGSYYGDEQV